ncbi:Uncharacterised protein [Mycobacterium tuberculosis]|uniref:Uncharacterized protein n=1 Tax=Mycobacterium tuberculosis TaxID=1773 RepID=A0A654THK8_MYCTX|nr:Uncharacterised protein [Mycobacterium tuberculosis]CFE47144.1 Uncharacterised protein [Mycobacterium tuberculosis]CFR67154.1 Uncharacterised protein [Mycobacterium tuberculosis]CKP30652.1 Uncharacterised protein [Mycobacterium tuberculosis]CKQ94715.1 Uncharacterised protein [Mycobacterium tuberculosis]
MLHRAFHIGQHHPGVVGQLVAHRPGGKCQPLHRLNKGTRPVRIHGQRPQCRRGDRDHVGPVVSAAGASCGVISGDLAQRGHQHRHALAFIGVLLVPENVVALAGDDQQPGHVLRALAVAAHPEQIGQHARRADRPGARSGFGRRRQHRHRYHLGMRTLRWAHPDIFCCNGFQRICGRTGRQYIAEAADHRRVTTALGNGEQSHAYPGGRQHPGMVGGRRRELRQLLAHPLPRHRLDTHCQIGQLCRRKCRSDKSFPADSAFDQQRRDIGQ